jgi:carboxyl-terminal processing protease
MDRILKYHFEYKEINDVIVKRAFKIYIQSFDSEKSYLTASEVNYYLNISDEQLLSVVARIKNDDFSDFINLNKLIKASILRARQLREELKQDLSKITLVRDYEKAQEFVLDQQLLSERHKKLLGHLIYYYSNGNIVGKKDKIFALIEKRFKSIEHTYYGDGLTPIQKEHAFAANILKALSKSLDAHTAFFSDEEALDMRMNLEKQFEGLGVVLTESVDGVQIAEIVKNSPAEKSKMIQVNDIIVKIDHKSIIDWPFEKVLAELKKKSELTFEIKRIYNNAEEKCFVVKLKKMPIVMDEERLSYTYEQFGDGILGKIVIPSFYENEHGVSTDRDLKDAIANLRKIGNLKGLILDLRQNSGGFLSQAVKVAGLFLKNGVVCVSKYSNGEIRYLRNLNGDAEYKGPLILLVSKLSASASEIVAQCLQEYGSALIVGDERTFGKGTIQYQTITDKNADIFFKVTVGKYYTVSGKTTQIEGVISDIVVPTRFFSYNLGERYLENSLEPDQIAPSYEDKLLDLEGSTKKWFEKNYLPSAQKVISFWKKMVPTLKNNSEYRIAKNEKFQRFLQEQKQKPAMTMFNTMAADEDLTLVESVNILKDMINIAAKKQDVMAKQYKQKPLYTSDHDD